MWSSNIELTSWKFHYLLHRMTEKRGRITFWVLKKVRETEGTFDMVLNLFTKSNLNYLKNLNHFSTKSTVLQSNHNVSSRNEADQQFNAYIHQLNVFLNMEITMIWKESQIKIHWNEQVAHKTGVFDILSNIDNGAFLR